MVVTDHNLQLLAAILLGRGPVAVVAGEDIALLNDAPQLVNDGRCHIRHLSDDALRLVARVVEVPQLSVLLDFELDEFVPELSFVANAIIIIIIIKEEE